MRGKFRHGSRLRRWRDAIRGGLGNAQDHGVAVGDKEIAHAVGARARRDQRKTTPEEWMTGVCDFNFSQVVYQWVVDRGMKLFDPSTQSSKRRSWKKWLQVPSLPDPYGNGSRQELQIKKPSCQHKKVPRKEGSYHHS